MEIVALVFNSGTFEREKLRKLDERELYKLWINDKNAQVIMYFLDEFSEAFNNKEVSDQDWLFFVDLDNVK